jgi:hypothetical protein
VKSCNQTAVMEGYGITRESQAREELYRSKYVIDVDGTGRYLGLLRSRSLVFRASLKLTVAGNAFEV